MNPKINEVMESMAVQYGIPLADSESLLLEVYEAGKADYKLEHERVQNAVRESNQDQRELMNKVRAKDLDQALKGDKKKIAEIITWAKHEIEEYVKLIELLEKKLST